MRTYNIRCEDIEKAIIKPLDYNRFRDCRGRFLLNLKTGQKCSVKEVFRSAYYYANEEEWPKNKKHSYIAEKVLKQILSPDEWRIERSDWKDRRNSDKNLPISEPPIVGEMIRIYDKLESGFSNIYDKFLRECFSKGFWEGGPYENQRVLLKDSERARQEISEFQSQGIYIWGNFEEPLYVGKAKDQSFDRRFNRYIWGKNSQCKLAKESEKDNSFKFPENISSVRKDGAKKFAEKGTEYIWFILFPVIDKSLISILEVILIKVANDWNIKDNKGELVNKDK